MNCLCLVWLADQECCRQWSLGGNVWYRDGMHGSTSDGARQVGRH